VNVITAKIVAGCFALSAFAVAILAGLASDNPTAQILQRAVISMFVCYPVGLLVGMVCERVIIAHIKEHQLANPVSEASSSEPAAPSAPPADDEEAIVV
jgi:putative Mn2+ efflux pump MntP